MLIFQGVLRNWPIKTTPELHKKGHLEGFLDVGIGFDTTISSWWFFTNPIEKYAQVKLDHFPR